MPALPWTTFLCGNVRSRNANPLRGRGGRHGARRQKRRGARAPRLLRARDQGRGLRQGPPVPEGALLRSRERGARGDPGAHAAVLRKPARARGTLVLEPQKRAQGSEEEHRGLPQGGGGKLPSPTGGGRLRVVW